MLTSTIHDLADILATVPAHRRIATGHDLIALAQWSADRANAHNASFRWPDGRALAPHDWTQHLQSECLKAKAAYASQNPGKFAVAKVDNRDGLNAWEAAVIVLTDMARRAELAECAA